MTRHSPRLISATVASITRRGFNLSSSNSNVVGPPCKGFSLLEAAIVLGVVGLVISGIWVGAASYKASRDTNQVFTTVLALHEKLRNIFTYAVVENGVTWQETYRVFESLDGKIPGITSISGVYLGIDFGDYATIEVEIPAPGYPMMVIKINGLSKSVCLRAANRLKALMQTGSEIVSVTFYAEGVGFAGSYCKGLGSYGCTEDTTFSDQTGANLCLSDYNRIYFYFYADRQ